MYKESEILLGIEEFKKRVENGQRSFYEDLFRLATVRLLAHKYIYYILHDSITTDESYDCIEKEWYMMGRGLGVLNVDETSPCVDFNFEHELANEAIQMANKWGKFKIKTKRD